ncbi:MAG: hypothetical protein QXZ02_01950 [Candidatus Bathyarchaeia archaeon]
MAWKTLRQGQVLKEFFPAFIIAANTLSWNTLALAIFGNSVNSLPISQVESIAIFGVEYLAIALSAILGSMFFPQRRRISLSIWILFGTLMSFFLITIPNNGLAVNLMISFFFGVGIGTGLPSALAYFADATVTENRGFFGGITFFFAGFLTILFVVTSIFLNNIMNVLMISLWRVIGLILFFSTSKHEKVHSERKPSYVDVLSEKELILYLVPWVMFCLVNYMETPLIANKISELYGKEAYALIGFIEVALAGLFALVGGIIADYSGRKRAVIIGFVILGVEYAILSLLYEIPVSWYIYTAFDSIALGMFASVFFMTLWGDLARNYAKEKFYTVGGLPYLLASFSSILVKPYVEIIPLGMAFSLASFFLFLAVIPLMFAPETLPEKKLRERELRQYIEKAKKIKQKYV